MMMVDAGTVKHLSGHATGPNRYCFEWGTKARERSRLAVSRVLEQL